MHLPFHSGKHLKAALQPTCIVLVRLFLASLQALVCNQCSQ